jgi:autotransporter translocation and assembly factor TamB
VDVTLHVRDGGMSLLFALVPACDWQSGSAAVDLRIHGQLAAPAVQGVLRLSHGTLVSPALKHPVTQLNANVQVGGSVGVTENDVQHIPWR